MKRLIVLVMTILSMGSQAQSYVSPNLIGSQNITGVTPVTISGGGYSGGSTPGYNSSLNTIMMGYVNGTAAYKYAFSTALQNSGIVFQGYNYSWDYLNQDLSSGTLSANINFAAIDGSSLHSKSFSLGHTTSWTTVSGTETFTNSLAASNISSFSLSFTGRDGRYWAGYYGPQVRNASMSLNYSFDQCASNPLSSPSCPGYAQSYHDQQCLANPLYATDCPGYQQAYYTQQCAANPLYATTCPGYQQAYHDQQCRISPLYATDCIGYTQAYHDQQCRTNPLYATDCTGYQQAYHDQQCSINPLYATDCSGYEQAYLNAQCIKDSLYSRLCTGYATAYAIKYLTPVDPAVNTVLSNNAAAKAEVPAYISATGNSTVDSVLTTPSTTSPTSPTSVTSTLNSSPANSVSSAQSASVQPPPPPQEQKMEGKKVDGAVASVEKKAGGNKADAKAAAGERAKELAKDMSKAKTLEDQVQNQGLVVGLMGYVPGFNAYQNSMVPDVLGTAVARQYYKPSVDNKSAQRRLAGANEQRWQEMVDKQYQGN